MPFVLWTILCVLAYAVGLIIMVIVTPKLLSRAYNEGLFMAIAAAEVVGGMLAFGAVALTFGLFSGAFPIRVLDFVLLVGILLLGARLAYTTLRAYRAGTYRSSYIVVASYCFLLCLTAVYLMRLLFT